MIKKIDHIAIAVKSIEEAKKFYENLGLKISPPEIIPEQNVKVAFIEIGDTKIELVEALGAGSIQKFIDKHGEGIHHICLETNNIENETESLKKKNYHFIYAQASRGAEKSRINFLKPIDTNGVLIELKEKSPGRRPSGIS